MAAIMIISHVWWRFCGHFPLSLNHAQKRFENQRPFWTLETAVEQIILWTRSFTRLWWSSHPHHMLLNRTMKAMSWPFERGQRSRFVIENSLFSEPWHLLVSLLMLYSKPWPRFPSQTRPFIELHRKRNTNLSDNKSSVNMLYMGTLYTFNALGTYHHV